MRVPLRETGSIHVRAGKDEVMDVLRRTMLGGSVVGPDRIEGMGRTYIVREGTTGTQVIAARRETSPLSMATKDRGELRRAVESDLFQLQRLFDAK